MVVANQTELQKIESTRSPNPVPTCQVPLGPIFPY